jgi:HAD superfamily hydrolase (TIGR01549 family)
MLVIFDLDQTLVDSRVCEPHRKARQWPEVYAKIPKIQEYVGVSDLLNELKDLGIDTCVVTSSPRPYCERVLRRFGWVFRKTVCYHDTARRKPHADPYLAAMAQFGAEAADTVAVGDAANDIYAAESGGIFSIGTLWGSADGDALRESSPDVICESVEELRQALLEFKGGREK